ncbi:dihydroneopterin aldolase [uncultured Campylobacter sp.]|uniref:dihydroneopterin aldolase n=1 Tax=uncultured Campylobacter sp. TaxID=218934 RepID=UPI00261642F4|nr:dihydroneopterin aldolase [uncultured Campylobacter sp.]
MTTIFIKELKFQTIIGILEHERQNKQEISLDIKLRADEFIDYTQVIYETKALFESEEFFYVEDALNFFKVFFKKRFKTLKFLKMKITKEKIVADAKVGAILKWHY